MSAERERIAELEEQVAYWKGEAQHNHSAETTDRIRRAFDLTRGEAWILGVLYAARGDVVRRERIEEDMPGDKHWEEKQDSANLVAVMVSRIRSKTSPEAIETARGFGYRLSGKMIARIDAFVRAK